jgi:short-chain fatty acids transporter
MAKTNGATPGGVAEDAGRGDGTLVRLAIAFTAWAERWFPDAFIFVGIAVVIVALGAMANGATPIAVSQAFGNGFWSLIPFTMQMAFIVIGGYVVASSPPAQRLIRAVAGWPRTGTGAVGVVAAASMLASLLNWGFSLIVGGLLVRALAERRELNMDYRAAGAAAYLGLGATWAMGLSSSAAQLEANAASMPKSLLAITGVIPFTETIFMWQSYLITAVLLVVSTTIAIWSAPGPAVAMTADKLGIDVAREQTIKETPPQKPGDWLEYSPLLTILIVLLAAGWLYYEFSRQSTILAISNLNTYNFMFVMAGLLLHWRPRRFLAAVAKAVPAVTGVLIQFPLYGSISTILTQAKNGAGTTLSDQISNGFVSISTEHSYPLVIGVYSAILGFFVPSGGGKWLLEAPYVMQAANELKVHLGWAVQIYNAAEALPNLINPFWMLPLLGIIGLRARDLVGFTFLQLIVHLPLVLFLLWALAFTLPYHPPVIP